MPFKTSRVIRAAKEYNKNPTSSNKEALSRAIKSTKSSSSHKKHSRAKPSTTSSVPIQNNPIVPKQTQEAVSKIEESQKPRTVVTEKPTNVYRGSPSHPSHIKTDVESFLETYKKEGVDVLKNKSGTYTTQSQLRPPKTFIPPSVRKAVENIESNQPPPPPSVSFTTGMNLEAEKARILSRLGQQLSSIDVNKQYQLSNGQIVSGAELRKQLQSDIRNIVTQKPYSPGSIFAMYGNQLVELPPEAQYLIQHSNMHPYEAIKLLKSGQASKLYESLPEEKKIEYGTKFHPFTSEPIETWKYYPGGKEYIEKHRNKIINDYIKQKGGYNRFVSSLSHGQYNELLELKDYLESKGIISRHMPSLNIDWSKGDYAKVVRLYVEDILTRPDEERRELYFSRLPMWQRAFQSGGYAAVSTLAFPVTASEWAIKTATGAKEVPILTSATKSIYDIRPGGPSGLISTGISEAISAVKGEETNAWKRFTEHPISGIFATAGELTGAIASDYLGKVAKYGLYRTGIPIKTYLVKRGLMSELPISRYHPTNLLRTYYWRLKTHLGKAKFIPEEEVWHPEVLSGEAKFAYAKRGVPEMVKYFEETKTSPISKGEILGIHAAPHRFRYITHIKKGASETPGLSISAFGKGSPRFTRIGTEVPYTLKLPTNIKISLLPKLKLPTGVIVKLERLYRLPYSLRKILPGETIEEYYKRVSDYLLSQPSGKYATIAAKAEIGGPEIEAIIKAGTPIRRLRSYYYTTYKGHIVPLPEYTPLGTGIPYGAELAASKNFINSISEFLSPYSYTSSESIPLIRPYPIISPYYKEKTYKYTPSFKQLQSFTFPSYNLSYSKIASYPTSSFKPASQSSKTYTSKELPKSRQPTSKQPKSSIYQSKYSPILYSSTSQSLSSIKATSYHTPIYKSFNSPTVTSRKTTFKSPVKKVSKKIQKTTHIKEEPRHTKKLKKRGYFERQYKIPELYKLSKPVWFKASRSHHSLV